MLLDTFSFYYFIILLIGSADEALPWNGFCWDADWMNIPFHCRRWWCGQKLIMRGGAFFRYAYILNYSGKPFFIIVIEKKCAVFLFVFFFLAYKSATDTTIITKFVFPFFFFLFAFHRGNGKAIGLLMKHGPHNGASFESEKFTLPLFAYKSVTWIRHAFKAPVYSITAV